MSTSYSNPGGTGDRFSLIPVTSSGSFVGLVSSLVEGSQDNELSFGSGATSTFWIRFDFALFSGGGRAIIDEAKWYQSTADGHGVWQWEGSNNGTSWTAIGSSFSFGGVSPQTITSMAGNTTAYRYYRLRGVSGSVSTSSFIREIEFRIETVSSGQKQSKVFIMTTP